MQGQLGPTGFTPTTHSEAGLKHVVSVLTEEGSRFWRAGEGVHVHEVTANERTGSWERNGLCRC